MTDDTAASAKAEQPDPRFEGAGFPASLYIGKEAGQWVLATFADEVHAVEWMKTAPGKRSMHRVTLCDIVELELEQPKPFLKVRER